MIRELIGALLLLNIIPLMGSLLAAATSRHYWAEFLDAFIDVWKFQLAILIAIIVAFLGIWLISGGQV